MIHNTPAAFRRMAADGLLNDITAGVHEIKDVHEALDRLLANIAGVLKCLQSTSEANGYEPSAVASGIDEIRDVLLQRSHMITAAVIRDTELDV